MAEGAVGQSPPGSGGQVGEQVDFAALLGSLGQQALGRANHSGHRPALFRGRDGLDLLQGRDAVGPQPGRSRPGPSEHREPAAARPDTKAAPQPIRLKLDGVESLLIRVDFGEDGLDYADHVDLVAARLIK